ncbi:FtsW/RodA/SpoVE family cell cycle protein [TM7 phylum sp. oral taxon 349]|jgi:bacterial cell division membrane protein|nr:FtsW/RodA/SpoVE family cell cycle protein [TM7 phylum sp. oral taxon 349]
MKGLASSRRETARVRVKSREQRRHRPDYMIIMCMGVLMLIGLVVMYAIGPQRANVMNAAYNGSYSATYFAFKQFVSLLLALGVFVALALVPFSTLKNQATKIMAAAIIASALLFLVGNVAHIDTFAQATLGAYRWFNLGSFGGFQPSELMKFAVVIFMAVFLSSRYQQGKIDDLKETVYPMAGLLALLLLIVVVIQKDMGTGVSIAAAVVSMFIVSTMNWKILAKIAGVGVILGLLLVVLSPHRMERISTFFSSGNDVAAADERDNNYHIKNAMIALGTGGLFGRGIGKSIQATGYLPEAVNDSIFAIMGEIFGFAGTICIIGLFGILLFRILRIADQLPDMSMRIAAAGVFGWLLAHVVMNIASMIGLIPLTGITLPLLSFGGTSMIFMSGALGVVFQLSRYTNHKSVTMKEDARADFGSRRRVGRTRYAGRRSIA